MLRERPTAGGGGMGFAARGAVRTGATCPAESASASAHCASGSFGGKTAQLLPRACLLHSGREQHLSDIMDQKMPDLLVSAWKEPCMCQYHRATMPPLSNHQSDRQGALHDPSCKCIAATEEPARQRFCRTPVVHCSVMIS